MKIVIIDHVNNTVDLLDRDNISHVKFVVEAVSNNNQKHRRFSLKVVDLNNTSFYYSHSIKDQGQEYSEREWKDWILSVKENQHFFEHKEFLQIRDIARALIFREGITRMDEELIFEFGGERLCRLN